MGAIFSNGKSVLRESAGVSSRGAGVRVGMLEEPVFSKFTIDPRRHTVSIVLIGVEVKWKKGKGFLEMGKDGKPDCVAPEASVTVFKRLLAQDAARGNENARKMIERNMELRV